MIDCPRDTSEITRQTLVNYLLRVKFAVLLSVISNQYS